jgi:outer membrane protein assembly factor BamB
VAADGTIYFLSKDTIIALDKNGNEQWKFKTNGSTAFGPTIGLDGTIYQGSWDDYFYAINKDGTLKWKYKTAGSISYPASIDRNGTIYLGGGDAHSGPDSNLYVFNPDGSLKWKYDTKALRVGSPAIGPDGLIYVPAAPSLFVLDSAGNLKWKKGPEVGFNLIPLAFAAECGAPPLPPCGGMGQPQTGNMLPPGSGMPSKDDIAGIITPAIASDGTIYIGNAQGILSAINPETQEVKWTYQTGVDPKQAGFYGLPSFPLVDKDGVVYIGSVDGKMYAVDKNGKLVWDYQTGGKISEASPAFGPDGTLYFTSMDNYLYAIGN